ncbi:MAG: sulfotransferase, partial [Pseudomonadales bacterium]
MSYDRAQARPDWVRRINYMGESVGGAQHLVSLDPDEMLVFAQQSTGLSDFADDWDDDSAEGWRTAYYKLIESYETEGQLTTVGRLATRQEMIRTLRTRLLLVNEHRKRPELAETEIEKPVFIVGQSRTGTTIIHELMALNEHMRAPLAWESIHPVEVSGASKADGLAWAECEQEFFEDVVPEFAAVHELRAGLPMECLLMMALEFSGGWAATTANVDGFLAWRAGTSSLPSYKMHKRFLQFLQADSKPQQWLLKSPAHLMELPALFSVYPDARIVHTHRDPVKTIASTISTVATSRYARCDNIALETLAFAIPIGFEMALQSGIALRDQGKLPLEQIADVKYQDFLRAPVNTLLDAFEK